MMYVADYGDWLPFGWEQGGFRGGFADSDIGAWFVLLAPYVNVPVFDFYRLGEPVPWPFDWITERNVFHCPSQVIAFPSFGSTYAPSMVTASSDRAAIINASPLRRMGKLNRVITPSEKVWLADGTPLAAMTDGRFFFNPVLIDGTPEAGGFSFPHSQGTNLLFFDGSVRWVAIEEAIAVSGSARLMFRTYD